VVPWDDTKKWSYGVLHHGCYDVYRLVVAAPSVVSSRTYQRIARIVPITLVCILFLLIEMTPRVWILTIVCVLAAPLLYGLGRYLRQSPFTQPYLRIVSWLFAVPDYTRGDQKNLSDFGSGMTLLVACEWGSPDCVVTLPRLTALAQTYAWLAIYIVTLSDRFFSSDFPQIQYSRFTWLPPICHRLPQFWVIKNGVVVRDSCQDGDWIEEIEKKSIDWELKE